MTPAGDGRRRLDREKQSRHSRLSIYRPTLNAAAGGSSLEERLDDLVEMGEPSFSSSRRSVGLARGGGSSTRGSVASVAPASVTPPPLLDEGRASSDGGSPKQKAHRKRKVRPKAKSSRAPRAPRAPSTPSPAPSGISSARKLAAELKRVRAEHHSAAVAAIKAGKGHRIEGWRPS